MNSPLSNNVIDLTIIDTQSSNKGLEVSFSDQTKPINFSWFWLKDHGIDEASLDPDTLQRKVNTFDIDPNIEASSFDFNIESQIGEITWPDGSTSTISADLLLRAVNRKPSSDQLIPNTEQVLWDKDNSLDELPTVTYQAVMDSDSGVLDWLNNIAVYGFSLVQDVPSTEAATEALAKRIGDIEETIFGTVWMLSAELNEHDDTAYSNSYLEPHTDATYYHDAAGLQMFNCFEFDGTGGESIQVDAFAIANKIKQQDPEAYKTLSEVIVPGHYLEPGVHLHAERQPFKHNNKGELIQVSFNNYDRAPFMLPHDEMERFYHAYRLFHSHALDEDNWIKVPLRKGMTLIFDNWRVMHGRMAYKGKRVFCGCYHNRAEFESKLRVLQASQ